VTKIEQLLRERIGLDAASIGSSSIQRTVRLRMKALGVAAPEEYRKLLEKSRTEWTELIEAIVVTETWFFRDRDPFNAFVKLVREEWLSPGTKGALRVLSVPCSSGEEPYSLVMALLDAGIAPERFQIDAADISPRGLNRARRAIYGRNSFRGKDLAFRDHYFHHTKEGYVLCPAVRSAVRFFEGNILSPNFLPGKGTYDIIFCRNLLIYFDRQTQAKALAAINRLLSPSGVLIVGAAEQPLALENGFVSANIPMAFACRKRAPVQTRPAVHPQPMRFLNLPPIPASLPNKLPKSNLSSQQRMPSPQPRPPGTAFGANSAGMLDAKALRGSRPTEYPAVSQPVPDLARARRLADEGRLKEAAAVCQTHLRAEAGSAPAWYLLGLIRDASGDSLAADCYRKALYLNPNHYETLLQMALLSEKSGDATRARTFRMRAARVKAPPATTSQQARV